MGCGYVDVFMQIKTGGKCILVICIYLLFRYLFLTVFSLYATGE